RGRPVTEDRGDRVGRNQVGQQERHDGHAPDQQDRDAHPDEDIAQQRRDPRWSDPLCPVVRGLCGGAVGGVDRHSHSAFAKSNETSALDTYFVMLLPMATVATGWTSGIHTPVSVVALNSFA